MSEESVNAPAWNKSGVHARTMLAAAETLGGLSELAEFLKVSRAEVLRWVAGAERLPQVVFLQAVDLVLENNEKLRGELKILPRASSAVLFPPSEPDR